MQRNSEQVITVTGVSNRQFLERYAAAGRIGLSGGITFVDKAICRAQRHLHPEETWAAWSHAFLFQGQRVDGHHWVVESDLQVHHKHIQLGVQENRLDKYFDEELYTCFAVLDLGLSQAQVGGLLSEALDLVANRARYSVRELIGTMLALRHPELRSRTNVLARDRSMYCSAFVQHLFRKSGFDLAPGVDLKNTTPEDIARTNVPHVMYLMQRQVARSKLSALKTRFRRRLGAHVRKLKRDSQAVKKL